MKVIETFNKKLISSFSDWMAEEKPGPSFPLCDFERTTYESRPCDVLLIEGRSRISEIIKQLTQSPWSHACLYIGRLHDIEDPIIKARIEEHYAGDPGVQLVVEGYIGKGTIISPLQNYQADHIRICRPRGLSKEDAQHVIKYAVSRLGTHYDLRQLFDMGRYLLPWSILPRRWRSTLFDYQSESNKTICSSMIAEAFASIDFPILPVIKQNEAKGVELYIRNPRLLTPRDFDYSPYFEIIKFPMLSFHDSPYRSLPWNRDGLFSHDGENIKKFNELAKKNKNHHDPLLTKDIMDDEDFDEEEPNKDSIFSQIYLQFSKLFPQIKNKK